MFTMATDPGCGMTVEREIAISLELEGQVFYFCARGCWDKFLENPGRYLGALIVRLKGKIGG